jgi:hypothetical protein
MLMLAYSRLRVSAVVTALLLGGCSDYLTAPDALHDPNNPSSATTNQSFMAAQAGLFALQESHVTMDICQWMQQCAGVGGRFLEDEGNYNIDATIFNSDWIGIYTGGGLVDVRRVQSLADASGDKTYGAIARIIEAINVSYAADVWGDMPYREALTSATPVFDPQMQVYDDLQTLLDRAIADLTTGTGAGPGAFDLMYGGDRQRWIAAAYTLKARLYMHTVEKLGPGQYAKAIAAAQKGIASAANDLRSVHAGGSLAERHMWVQFFQASGFGEDLVAGALLANLMKAQSDPRLSVYFTRNPAGDYGGFDVTAASTTPAAQISKIYPTTRLDASGTFRHPILTWSENQLILAEALFQTSGAAAALPFLTAERASAGLGATPATLQSIMEEKYVSLFMSAEVWNDWKRTCLPRLAPAVDQPAILERVFYGSTEENSNPNTPSTKTQSSTNGFRNTNDPVACAP